jgi:Predicted site-specific integrase-resolvase
MNNYKPQEFAEMIGISVKTLQRWDREGKLKAYRTPSDRRYYTDEHLQIFNEGRKMICSNLTKQKSDQRQNNG